MDVLIVCGALGTMSTGVAVVFAVVKFLKKMGNFVDDWNGEPDRPGVPGRPGVMKRLESIESEVRTNHGSSLKDAVNRIDTNLNELREDFSDHVKIQADYNDLRDELRDKLPDHVKVRVDYSEGRIPGMLDESN
jgi:hypothetical protein